MDKFFHPRSVAVFGVSDKPMNLASGVLFNLSRRRARGGCACDPRAMTRSGLIRGVCSRVLMNNSGQGGQA